MDSLTVILSHYCNPILLAKMLIWAPFSQSMCTFSFWINPCRVPLQTLTLLTLPQDALSCFFILYSFRPTTIPISNTNLLFTPFLGRHSCAHFSNILLLIYRCLPYHTCIADCCVYPWRYNTKLEQHLIDLYWNIRTCILLAKY